MQNLKSALKFLAIDLIGSVVYFLPWWYYRGTLKILRLLGYHAKDLVRTLNLSTLAKFLFTPMYGLTDPVSRAISLPVRIVHFAILTTIALVYMSGLLILLILWLAAPLLVIYNILYQLNMMPINIYEYIWV